MSVIAPGAVAIMKASSSRAWRRHSRPKTCRLEPVEVPIACNLSAEGASSQLEEWRQLLAEFPGARVSPTHLVVRIAVGPAAVAPVIGLAQREKACCPFFDFSLKVEADAVVLHVSVPEDATSILDALSSVLG
jgi:MerR family copper efflux transcriptional regulator